MGFIVHKDMKMNVHTPIPVEPNAVELRQAREQNAQRPRPRSQWWLWLLVLAVLGCGDTGCSKNRGSACRSPPSRRRGLSPKACP